MNAKRITDIKSRKAALDLALRVFMEFEAPEYPEQGILEFRRSLDDPSYTGQLSFYAAFDDNGQIVGTLATRSGGSHIALFFVDADHQHKGIGKTLFSLAFEDCPTEKMTVFSSPYAIPIYERLGFRATDTEQTVNGIRFTPMELVKK